MSTGEPGSSRVPYRRSCSSSKRSTSAGDPRRVELAGQLDRDAPALAAVADVGDAPPLGLAVDPRREVARACRRRGGERVEVGLARADPAEADVVVLGPREQQPGGGEEPGERRHDRRARAELGRERRGVDRAGAAVGDEREVGRVAALLGRDGAQRAHRRRVREVVDAARRLERREAELRAERADGLLGQLARDGQRAGRERAGRDVAEHDVGVGHGRLGAAEAVAGRARATRPRCAARRAGRRPRRARRSSRRRRRPRRCRSSGCGSARREPRSSRLPEDSAAPTSYSWLSETRPSWISDALAVVPPRSKAIAFAWPSCRASESAATTPAAGPGLERVDGPRGRVGGGHRRRPRTAAP